jgi:MYXO-CTERM domain-containing protein
MIFPSRRRTVWAMMVLLAVIVAVLSPAVALAQAPPGTPVPGAPPGQIAEPPPTRTVTSDDSGNWGLFGLLGLVGLAGLLRRDRRRSVTVADRPDRR